MKFSPQPYRAAAELKCSVHGVPVEFANNKFTAVYVAIPEVIEIGQVPMYFIVFWHREFRSGFQLRRRVVLKRDTEFKFAIYRVM